MDDQAACEINAVEEQEGHTMYPLRFIEAVANSVKRTRSHLSIGESRLSAAPAYRSGQHENDVDAKKESNAFFKHLRLFHPDAQGGIENFDIRVNSVHKKPLTRQKTEAVKIASSTATNLLNSKAEHRQPALLRVRMVQGDDSDVQGPRPGAGDGGGGGGGEGEGDEQAGHRGRRRRGE